MTGTNYLLVQTVNPAVSTGTITATVTNTQVGSLILVFIGMSALTETVSTVTDAAGNTYTNAYAIATGTGGRTELWYAPKAAPTTSVVVTFSASVLTKSVFVREYSGMAQGTVVLDRTQTRSSTGTAVDTFGTSATRSADELLVCSCSYVIADADLVPTGGYGNFSQQTIIAAASTHGIEDQTATTKGTKSGNMTGNSVSGAWDAGIATFVIAEGRFVVTLNRPGPFKPGNAR